MRAQTIPVGTTVSIVRDSGETVNREVRSNVRAAGGDFRSIAFVGIEGVSFRYPILHNFDVSMDSPLPFPEG